MSEDRTPRTISLTSNEDEGEELRPHRSRARRRHRRDDAPDEVRLDPPQGEEGEHLEEMDPRDRARMTAR